MTEHDKTEPAAGSSAATDVSIREYTARDLWWLDRHLSGEIEALRNLVTSWRESDQNAITTALTSAKELAEKHNDLIRSGERKEETYASKEEVGRLAGWQAKMSGGLIVLGFIGVANLVKVWTG
jgi:hypothetical protein